MKKAQSLFRIAFVAAAMTPVRAAPQESERMMSDLEGAASILAMLEEKAGSGSVTPSEIAAVRCVVESCASDLDDAWAGV